MTNLKLILGAGLAVGLVSMDAVAAEPTRGDAAGARTEGNYTAAGVPAGAFKLFPVLEVKETYNSNIYAATTGAQSDFITTVSPQARLQSDFNRHAINLAVGADVNVYADNTDENYNDYNAAIDGRLDVLRDTKLIGGASYRLLHEDRSAPDSNSSDKEPTEYSLASFNAGGSHKINRVSLGLDGKREVYDFDDNKTNAGAIVNNDDRDRDVDTLTGRVGYEVTPGYEAFVRSTFNNRDYDLNLDDSGFDRDSTGWDLVGGAKVELSGKLVGDVFAGYMRQEYDDARFGTVSGVTGGLGMRWNPTQLTTVSPRISRTIEETTSTNYVAYIATTVGVTVEHELKRNILLNANGSYANNDYERATTQTGTVKNEDTYNVGAGAKYLLNRNFYLGGDYSFSMKDSNQAASDTRTHKGMLKIGAQL